MMFVPGELNWQHSGRWSVSRPAEADW